MAKLTSIPINDASNNEYTSRPYSQQQHQNTIVSRFNVRLDNNFVDSNPLLKSLYDQVDSMLQQSSGQDVTKIFFTVLMAINKNLSDSNSPLSMNSDANDLRRLYSFPSNGRLNLTLSLLRSSRQSTTPSSSSSSSSSSREEIEESSDSEDFSSSHPSYRLDSDLLPPPPETCD
ncbi:hypothetical protein GLOIN_2v1590884 [Rhizophagus clarus]|uniref:Uncharacterized protein n=1 Tax=Rhizophagus clarus TaxID=94130 RepID=A0A8H3QI97_9GLOM|nr:hypothetical protein GLOIN_2v1590884 [Rhizophagus clarus]